MVHGTFDKLNVFSMWFNFDSFSTFGVFVQTMSLLQILNSISATQLVNLAIPIGVRLFTPERRTCPESLHQNRVSDYYYYYGDEWNVSIFLSLTAITRFCACAHPRIKNGCQSDRTKYIGQPKTNMHCGYYKYIKVQHYRKEIILAIRLSYFFDSWPRKPEFK
jgi:hypothetical protein